MLLDGYQVGKSLKGVNSSCLHSEDRTTRVLNKLIQNGFCIVILTIGKTCKRAHSDKVAIASHHWDGLEQVLTLVAIHDDTTLRLEFPSSGIDIEHDDVHAKIHGCFLGRETGAQTVIEEDHHQRLVLTQMLILETVVLDVLCFGEGLTEVADILHIDKTLHNSYII